ncbi:MAG: hypothetical protein L0220_25010 [Acidobacteria bacterium]|nr:hypothetical protein [Acidobacteriota bacterium]
MNYPEENSPDQLQKPADDVIEDKELKNLLAQWKTPEIPGALDQRLFTAYRRQFHYRSGWRRYFTGSIRLPIPVAATALILLCASSYFALRRTTNYYLDPSQTTQPVKFLEVPVPVVQEKIVTRIVYKKTEAQNWVLHDESYNASPVELKDLNLYSNGNCCLYGALGDVSLLPHPK